MHLTCRASADKVPRRGAPGLAGVRLWVLALALSGAAASALGQTPAPPAEPGTPPPGVEFSADRDSLLSEIKVYTRMIRSLRDSLSGDQIGLRLSEAQRLKLEGNIAEISEVIERISGEMSRMEFQIRDNRISLVNEAGEGIIINVPEDLDTKVSQGIEAITKVILSELPDSIDFDRSWRWDWSRFSPDPPPPPRRVINGNIVKVWNDVDISAKEDVRGNVVVVFGDAVVSGRVDGSVVTVFGSLRLTEAAEVTGTVVAVGGDLEQDPGAVVEDVVAINPFGSAQAVGWRGLFRHDGLSFLLSQGAFLLTLLLAVVVVAVTPQRRFDVITGCLTRTPAACFGTGVLTALAGHAAAAVLMGVLVLTVIGVPLALLVGLALLVVIVLAVAVCGGVVGRWLCARVGSECRTPWLTVMLGMTVLHVVGFVGALLGLVGAPSALATALVISGLMIKLLAYTFGIGAMVLSRFGARASAP